MATGVSISPLAKKLGMRAGQRVLVLNPPPSYRVLLEALSRGITIADGSGGELDFVHLFATNERDLERAFPAAKKRLAKDGILWASWPKGRSLEPASLSESTVRAIGLRNGLVDVKICSVDPTWSALKFVFRARDRG